jgi:hypothetical protein
MDTSDAYQKIAGSAFFSVLATQSFIEDILKRDPEIELEEKIALVLKKPVIFMWSNKLPMAWRAFIRGYFWQHPIAGEVVITEPEPTAEEAAAIKKVMDDYDEGKVSMPFIGGLN